LGILSTVFLRTKPPSASTINAGANQNRTWSRRTLAATRFPPTLVASPSVFLTGSQLAQTENSPFSPRKIGCRCQPIFPGFISQPEAARRRGVTRQAIAKLVRQGKMKSTTSRAGNFCANPKC
jgi:hypothetical protein